MSINNELKFITFWVVIVTQKFLLRTKKIFFKKYYVFIIFCN